jgi:hypothetical protein
MDCTDFKIRIDGLLDGSLCGDEQAEARKHADSCVNCRAALDRARQTDDETREILVGVGPSGGLVERIFRETTDLEIRPSIIRPSWWAMGAAAVVILAVSLGYIRPAQEHGDIGLSQGPVIEMSSSAGGVGDAFVVGGSGQVVPYRGRTSVQVVWNISQNSTELIVDAFPWEE